LEERVARVIVFCGKDAQARGLKAKEIVRNVSQTMGGSGGGDERFGRGGGSLINKAEDVKLALYSYIEKMIKERMP
jgi:alanyl-tRNA synthetase